VRSLEEFAGGGGLLFVSTPAKRHRLHRVFLRNGGVQGLHDAHDNYLEQCVALHFALSFLAWRALSQYPAHKSRHRFMVGFFGPFTLRRPQSSPANPAARYVREAFAKYKITYVSLVPLVLKNLQKGLQARFDACRREAQILTLWSASNRAVTKDRPCPSSSRLLLKQVHAAFRRQTPRHHSVRLCGARESAVFFYDLGIPVANGYGLTEAGTAITVNDLKPFSRGHRRQAAARHGGSHRRPGRPRNR